MNQTHEQKEQIAHWDSIKKELKWKRYPLIVFGMLYIFCMNVRLDRIFDYIGYFGGREAGRRSLLHANLQRARKKGQFEEAKEMAEKLLSQIEPLQSNNPLIRSMKHDSYFAIGRAYLQSGDEEKAGDFLIRAGEALRNNSVEGMKLSRLSPYLRAGLKRPVFAYLKIIEILWADCDFAKRYRLSEERHEQVRRWKQTINQGCIPDDRYWS